MIKPIKMLISPIMMGIGSMMLVACGGHETGTGMISLDITDAPIDSASKVMVQFSSVEVHGEENKTIVLETPIQLNLLDLTGSQSSALLSNETLAAGRYQWLKLGVDTAGDLDTYIELDDGTVHELDIPSGSETGLKLNRGFTIAEGGMVDFTIDFDLRKSVVNNNQGYQLKPTLRIVDNLEIGHVKGTVTASLLEGAACTSGNSVYVFEGVDATVTDVSTISNVLTTASIELNTDGVYEYEVGFLNAGEYTFAVTCQSGDDDPDAVDASLVFVAQSNITVETQNKATLDF